MPGEPSQSSLEIIEGRRRELEPLGWTIEIGPHRGWSAEPRIDLRLEHPLSGSTGLNWPDDKTFAEGFRELITTREFGVVASRPHKMPHSSLIGSIRKAAAVHGWGFDTVGVIARVLRHEGLLTDEEAGWLEEAGPAWAESPRGN